MLLIVLVSGYLVPNERWTCVKSVTLRYVQRFASFSCRTTVFPFVVLSKAYTPKIFALFAKMNRSNSYSSLRQWQTASFFHSRPPNSFGFWQRNDVYSKPSTILIGFILPTSLLALSSQFIQTVDVQRNSVTSAWSRLSPVKSISSWRPTSLLPVAKLDWSYSSCSCCKSLSAWALSFSVRSDDGHIVGVASAIG